MTILYAIIADGIFDQVCEELSDVARECDDLREAGHRVKTLKFDGWTEFYAWEDRQL